jgi:threonine aldolase
MDEAVDLRSDTVTKPTPAMRAAMAEAAVGDDVLDEDPTVHRLQEKAAALIGMEQALFMPSGTMSNAVAIKAHTVPGNEVLMDVDSHSMLYEAGNPATISQALTRQYRSRSGIPDAAEIAGLIREESLHSPRTALILLENSHNRAGGAVIPLDVHKAVLAAARSRNALIHIDGARLFNAATALGVEAAEIAACADSVTFCLSKGLGCPVGSVLCGTHDFIFRARRIRKMLGGGMRQAGILAAAGLYALDNHLARLADDHACARRLAELLTDAPGLTLETQEPATNMVYIRTVAPAYTIAERLKESRGVLVLPMGRCTLRAVTHLEITARDIEKAAQAIRDVCVESVQT